MSLQNFVSKRLPAISAVWLNLVDNYIIGSGTKAPNDRTAAEIAAAKTPVNLAYEPGDARRWGVVGDGVTDDTLALQNALAVQQDVFIPDQFNCKTTGALALLSNQTLYGLGPESQITCTGVAINAINIIGKTRAVVRDLFVKYTGTATTGLNGSAVFIGGGSSFSTVTRCRLEGVRGGVTTNLSDDNIIDDNLITAVTIAPPEGSWDICIYLGGSRNRITRNRCFGGSFNGVQVISDVGTFTDRNIIAENQISTHTGYGIAIYANLPGGTCEKNVISDNQIWDITGLIDTVGNRAKGMGIYVASAEWTVVSGNTLENTNVNTDLQTLTPGAIGINGVSCATIVGNIIKAPKWAGIYVAGDGNLLGGVVVSANVITSPTKQGIQVSNIINVTVIGNSVQSAGSTDNGIAYSNSGTGTGISIQNNKVKGFTAGSGIVATNVQCPNVSGNYVQGCSVGIQFDIGTGAFIIGNEVRSSTSTDLSLGASSGGFIHVDRNILRSAAVNGISDNGSGALYGINDVAGQTNPYVGVTIERVLATSATPSVQGSRMAAYGAATAVTDLLNGMTGQFITIRATGACTFQHNTGAATTKLLLNGAVNFVMAANNTLTLYLIPGGPWYEVARKV